MLGGEWKEPLPVGFLGEPGAFPLGLLASPSVASADGCDASWMRLSQIVATSVGCTRPEFPDNI